MQNKKQKLLIANYGGLMVKVRAFRVVRCRFGSRKCLKNVLPIQLLFYLKIRQKKLIK